MQNHGKAGPNHAKGPAELRIFSTGAPSHDLSQKTIPPRAGEELGHRLFRAVPKGPAPKAGWPILYMLDGNAVFDFLTADHLGLAAGLVLVGVGYDTDRQFSRERRTLDFTAPDKSAALADAAGIRPDHVHEGRMAGGGAAFLDRLTGDFRTLAETDLPIDPQRRTLWGHSFGGLFTLYALLSRPAAFARFAAISPSIWWDEALIRRIAEESPRSDAPPPLLVALGDLEKRTGSDGPTPDGPAPATLDFVQLLRARLGLDPRLHVLEGHRHIETLAGSFPLALPFAQE